MAFRCISVRTFYTHELSVRMYCLVVVCFFRNFFLVIVLAVVCAIQESWLSLLPLSHIFVKPLQYLKNRIVFWYSRYVLKYASIHIHYIEYCCVYLMPNRSPGRVFDLISFSEISHGNTRWRYHHHLMCQYGTAQTHTRVPRAHLHRKMRRAYYESLISLFHRTYCRYVCWSTFARRKLAAYTYTSTIYTISSFVEEITVYTDYTYMRTYMRSYLHTLHTYNLILEFCIHDFQLNNIIFIIFIIIAEISVRYRYCKEAYRWKIHSSFISRSPNVLCSSVHSGSVIFK